MDNKANQEEFYRVEEYNARVSWGSGNDYNLKAITFPYFTAGGHIQFQGYLKMGDVTLLHVVDKATREGVKVRIAGFLGELTGALGDIAKIMVKP